MPSRPLFEANRCCFLSRPTAARPVVERTIFLLTAYFARFDLSVQAEDILTADAMDLQGHGAAD